MKIGDGFYVPLCAQKKLQGRNTYATKGKEIMGISLSYSLVFFILIELKIGHMTQRV